MHFTYESLPQKVVFRTGGSRTALHGELDALGVGRVAVVHTPQESSLADDLTAPLRNLIACHIDDVKPHVPADVADIALRKARDADIDAILTIGGGSTTGMGKILARELNLPLVAVPTTYAGSEATPVWGMTTDGVKRTGRDVRCLPRTVLYDADLLATLPRELTVASAFNALAHSVEAFWAPGANPVTTAIATESVAALTDGLRRTTEGELDSDTHARLLYGAYLAGNAFAVAGSGLHHKLCHALGGAFDLPHAETHTVVLPYVLEFTAPGLGDDADRLARALGHTDPVEGLRSLVAATGAPTSLAPYGFTVGHIDRVVELMADFLPLPHPVPVDNDAITSILTSAAHQE